MSVPKPRRSPTAELLKVQDAAYRLYGYTVQAASNEKVVPVRHHWCTSRYLADAASAICREIDLANSLRTDVAKQKSMRAEHQCNAYGHCVNLVTELYKAFYAHNFDDDKLVYWLELIEATMSLVKAWAKSEDVVL